MVRTLEHMVPSRKPGSAHGYHALTYGWLAGELIRRFDPKQRSTGQFIQEEIADQTLLNFFIGLPADKEDRVSLFEISENMRQSSVDSNFYLVQQFNDPVFHRAEVPAANGIATAESIARLYAGLIDDLDGGQIKRILNEDTFKLATLSNTPEGELDLILKKQTSLGMGFWLFENDFPEFGPGSFGHGGLDEQQNY